MAITTTPAKKRRSRAKVQPKLVEFESFFNKEHPGFFGALLSVAPRLTYIELMICAMVRNSIQNWEIANRLSIKEHSVENHRYDVRKKLHLTHEQNL